MRAWLVWLGLSLAGASVAVWFIVEFGLERMGFDAYTYWSVDLSDPYARSFGDINAYGAFRYSPPIALAMASLGVIPWPLYLALWTAGLLALLVWLTGRWAFAAFVTIGLPMSLHLGNVDLIIAAAIVAGFRWPALWSVALLLKPTCAVGLLWHVVRGEWRALGVILATTALVALPTVLLWPEAWASWLGVLVDNAGIAQSAEVLPDVVRYPLAVAAVLLAARTDRKWLALIGVMFAQPVFSLRAVAVGVGAVRLWRTRPSAVQD